MQNLITEVWAGLGGTPDDVERLTVTGPDRTLTSTFPVVSAGAAAVGASLLAATTGSGVPVTLDTRGLAVALRSERYVRRDGRPVGTPFDPLSTFLRTADGWLRLHANYPWHRAAPSAFPTPRWCSAVTSRRPSRGRDGGRASWT